MTIPILGKHTGSEWPGLYIVDGAGKPLANLANALTVLRTDCGLSCALAFDADGAAVGAIFKH